METVQIATSWGPITLKLENGKVTECTLSFLNTTPRNAFQIADFQSLESNGVAAQRFAAQVQSFFQGSESNCVAAQIKPPPGTAFQQAVWKQLQKIPRGQTRTYGEIAAAIGRPNAVRAVGTACGANPIPLFIPCHRVVARNGLGGFGSGLPWKALLLGLEGAM